MVQIFDSCVLDSLKNCKNRIVKKDFNYLEDRAAMQDIVKINERWRYVFIEYAKSSLIDLFRLDVKHKDIWDLYAQGEFIAMFDMDRLPDEFIAEMVSRIIEEVESR